MEIYELGSSQKHSNHIFLSQIFYPTGLFDECGALDAYLIGWNLDNFRCLIACCLPVPSSSSGGDASADDRASYIAAIDNALRQTMDDLSSSLPLASSNHPIILGIWKHLMKDLYIPSSSEQSSSIWITITTDPSGQKESAPILHSVYSLGSIYYTSCYMIEYDKINTNSLECLRLEVTGNSKASTMNSDSNRGISSGARKNNDPYSSHDAKLAGQDIMVIIDCINAVQDLGQVLTQHITDLSKSSDQQPPDSPYMNNPETIIDMAEDASLLHPDLYSDGISTRASALVFIAYLFDSFCNGFLSILESKNLFSWWSIGQILAYWVGLRGNDGIGNDSFMIGVSLSEISLSAVHVREKIYYYKILIYQSIMFVKSWNKSTAVRSMLWRDLMRVVILIWFDMALGIMTGLFIYTNEKLICSYLGIVYEFTEKQYLKEAILWFNQNPGGVKLNSVITRRIGIALQYVIRIFEKLVTIRVAALHRPILLLIAFIGSLGFTIQCMIVIDIIRLATLHISTLHRCFGYQHKYQLELISSLFYLFYGKKKNILRKRIDTCEYDSQQLLFGIALFTMVIFLFPTFAAYFYLFAILDLMIVLINYSLWIWIVCLKEFPYYTMVEIISHRVLGMRIVGEGIQFQLTKIKSESSNHESNIPSAITKSLTAKLKSSSEKHHAAASPSLQSAMKKPGLSTKEAALSSRQGSRDDNDRAKVNFVDDVKSTPVDSYTSTANRPSAQSPTSQLTIDSAIDETLDFVDDMSLSPASRDSDLSDDERDKRQLSDANAELNASPDDAVVRAKLSVHRSQILSSSSLPTRRIFPRRSKTSNQLSSKHHHTEGSTIYLRLSPKSFSLAHFYLSYANYWEYFVKEKGLIWRLFNGMVHGRPSLDIQLIRATTDLSGIFRRPVAFNAEYFDLRMKRSSSSAEHVSSSYAKALHDDDASRQVDISLANIDCYGIINDLAHKYLDQSSSSKDKDATPSHRYRWNSFVLHTMLFTCLACLAIIILSTAIFTIFCITPYLKYALSFRTARVILPSSTIAHLNHSDTSRQLAEAIIGPKLLPNKGGMLYSFNHLIVNYFLGERKESIY
jgi:hypothetical protein